MFYSYLVAVSLSKIKTMNNYNDTLDKLKEYMSMYIQLIPYTYEAGGYKCGKHQLPEFKYFVDNYYNESYSLSIPHYKDVIDRNDVDFIMSVEQRPYKGLGQNNGYAYRYFNYWMGGAKFFTNRNVLGRYSLNRESWEGLEYATSVYINRVKSIYNHVMYRNGKTN